MEFLSQYESPELISEGETRSYRAREASTHRPVLLHQLSSNPGSGRQMRLLALVLRYTSGLRAGSPSPILAVEEHGDSVWVVTEDRPELANLWSWVDKQTVKKETAPLPVAPGVTRPVVLSDAENQQPAGALDEQTVLLGTRLASADSSPLVELGAPQDRPDEPEDRTVTLRSPAAPGKAGEFTALFRTPVAGGQSQPSGRPPESSGSDAAMPDPANEPTVILRRPAAANQPALAAGPVAPAAPQPDVMDASGGPGEFTMLYRKTPGAAGEQKPRFMGFTAPTQEKERFIDNPEPVAAPPAPRTPSAPGDITAMFGAPAAAPPHDSGLPEFPMHPAHDVLHTSEAGEFTQVFERQQPSRETSIPERQEPGAFTRIFQIPVGSDLLTAAKSESAVSRPAAPTPPSAWQDAAASRPLGAVAEPAPASPPWSVAPPKLPVVPAAPELPGGVKLPAAGGAPPALRPSVPAAPKLEPPKAPPLAAPKTPQLPAAAPAASGPSLLPLVLIFGGILLVAVLIVLFFVTKH